tara:strand:- start:4057 stop:4836 length:780 start_codon:yes stop_codon:yes gene_type:complete
MQRIHLKKEALLRLFFSCLLICTLFPTSGWAQMTKEQLQATKTRCVQKGNPVSCAKVGVYLEQKGLKKQAASFYKRACSDALKPQGMACYLLGLLDTAHAMTHFSRACKLNDADGCTSAGILLRKQSKPKMAASFFVKGCQLKDGRGCHRMARQLFRTNKTKLALQYLASSCGFGYPPGCGYAGWYYETKGKAPQKAEALYRKGCKLKGSISCARLGLLLARQRKFRPALRFLRRSCRWGFRRGCGLARKLNAQLKSKP